MKAAHSQAVKRKLSILFVSEYFYPRNAGGEIWSWELCKELARRGHKVTVLTCRYGDLPVEEKTEGVRIMRPVSTRYLRPVRRIATMRLAAHVREYVKHNKIDIIHVPAYTLNVAVSRIAKKAVIPCITAVHSYFGDDWKHVSPFWPFLRWLERRVLVKDRSQIIHVPSVYLQKRIYQDTKQNSVVIPNWIPDRFPKPKKLFRTALFVGSLERVKIRDTAELITTVRKLKMRLLIIGEGSLKKELEQEAAEQGISIVFLGSLPHEETLSYIGGASIVLVPSVTESFSLVAAEAAAQGTPVSGTSVGVLPELGVATYPPRGLPAKIKRVSYSKEKLVKRFESLYMQVRK